MTTDTMYVPFVVITIPPFPRSSFFNKSNMTGATCEAGKASVAPEFSGVFVSLCSILSIVCLFVLLSAIVLCPWNNGFRIPLW